MLSVRPLLHACHSAVSNSLQAVDCSPPGSSVCGILQARILEWVAISTFRGSSWPKDWTCISSISCIGRWILYHWATWEAPSRPHYSMWKLLALTSEYYDRFLLMDGGDSRLELKNRTFLFLTIWSQTVPQVKRRGESLLCFCIIHGIGPRWHKLLELQPRIHPGKVCSLTLTKFPLICYLKPWTQSIFLDVESERMWR